MNCRKCGRVLKNEPWKTAGIGPKCYKQENLLQTTVFIPPPKPIKPENNGNK